MNDWLGTKEIEKMKKMIDGEDYGFILPRDVAKRILHILNDEPYNDVKQKLNRLNETRR